YEDWGYSESILIDGDHLICTPGGDKGTLAALKKQTGDVVWQSKELKHQAPYSSAVVCEVSKVRMYIQMSFIDSDKGGFVSGFAADSGKVLWSEKIHDGPNCFALAPSPIVKGNQVYVTCGYGGGCHLFELSADGGKVTAKDLYGDKEQTLMKNTHGG